MIIRKNWILIAVIILILSSGINALAGEKCWTPKETMKVARVGDVWVSPCGKKVVYTVTRSIMNDKTDEWLTHIFLSDTKGKRTIQLTRGEKSCTNPRWSPDGKLIAFVTGRSGKSNLWLIRPDGGEAWQLTDVKTAVADYIWSPSGKKIAFTMPDPPPEEDKKPERVKPKVKDKDIPMSHIWIVPVDAKEQKVCKSKRITKGKFNVTGTFGKFGDWSPDGKTIVFSHSKTPSFNDWITSDISTVDVKTGKVTPLANSEAAELSPFYSPDGKTVAYTSSGIPPEWYFVSDPYIVSSQGGKPKPLAKTFDRWTTVTGWSEDGKYIYCYEGFGTGGILYKIPLDGKPPVKIMDNWKGKIIHIPTLNRSRKKVGFVIDSWNTPSEAYVSSIEKLNPIKVSNANGSLPHYALGKTELIRWKSKDGTEVEGILTYPVNYEKEKKYPLVLEIHGGPAGAYWNTFIANPGLCPIASLSAKGYAVLRCNIRGSSGYGLDFRKANMKDWGGMDYEDLMTGVDHVIDMGVADRGRLYVAGWSYGGYMTAWIITKTDRFKAAVVGAAPINLISFTGTCDVIDFVPFYFSCFFWDDTDTYMKHSSLFRVKNIKTPTLILHGEDDVRVPITQGVELYNALKKLGVTVEMVSYPKTGHGLSLPSIQLDVMERIMRWIENNG